jgi:hypothetical protein
MGAAAKYRAACFCGSVQLELSSAPVVMGYCHCESCRHWSASPVNAFSMWKLGSVRVVQGADQVGGFSKTPQAHRQWCKVCGGHLFTEHPELGLADVPAVLIAGLSFRPALHVNYGEKVLPIRDGLPKLSDIPAEMGGSGSTLPE